MDDVWVLVLIEFFGKGGWVSEYGDGVCGCGWFVVG